MKIPCLNCSFENELGRIFCSQCGKKLDLSRMSLDHVASERRKSILGSVLKFFSLILILVIFALTGLALWARVPLHEVSARTGSLRLAAQMTGVRNALRHGGETTVTMGTRDINAYISNYRAQAGLQTLTASIAPGLLTIRVTDQWGPWNIGSFRLGPFPYSYDLRCLPGGSSLRLGGAAVGRLPLPGPLARPVYRRMAAIFEKAATEKELLQRLEKVEFDTDLVKATFRP